MLEEFMRVGIDLARERDAAALVQRTVSHARRLTRAETGMLFLREEECLRLVEAQGDDGETPWRVPPKLPAEPIAPDSASVPARVAAIGTLLNIADLSSGDAPGAFPPGAGDIRSALVVPLADGMGKVIGVLALLNARGADGRVVPFDVAYEMPAGVLAAHAAAALEHARSHQAAQEQLRTATALLAVARALSGRAPLEEMMRRVGREVARAIGADAVGTYLLDAGKETLVPVAGYRLPKDLLEMFRRTSLALARAPGLHQALRDQRVIWSGDAGHDPRFDRQAYGQVAPHSALFAPTVARGEAIGGLYIAWWRTGREFLPAEIRLIEGVAAQVGLALENVDLARQTETKLRETETLLSVSRALSSTLDLQSLLRHFLRRVAQAVGADAVGSYLLDEDGEWLTPFQGYRLPAEHLDAMRRLRLSIRRHEFYTESAHAKRPRFSQDVAEDPRIPAVIRDGVPHRSQLFVPIVTKDRVIGALVAIWWQRARDFSEGDLAVIEAIATQAGVALENARLFEENRRQVKELSVLHALSRAVTGEVDRRALVEALYAQVALTFETRDVLILLPGQAERDVVVALRTRDGVREPAPSGPGSADHDGLADVVMKTGLPLRTDDYAGECARHGIGPSPGSAKLRHWLGVPMTTGDSVLGVVALAGAERPFTAADEGLLGNIARLAALALRIARLSEERETAYSELYLLSLVSQRALRRWHDRATETER